jgi:hypothetical protein
VHGVLMQTSIIASGVIAEAKVLAHMPHAARHRSAADMHALADSSNVSGPDHPADVSTAFEATDMASSHHPADMRAATETADMAATTKTASACLGCRGHQCRSQGSCCQDHHHSFHRKNPFGIEPLGR